MNDSFSAKIQNDIETRYAMFDRPVNGEVNVIIDSYVPNLLSGSWSAQQEVKNLPSTSYAISEYFANITNTRQLPLQYMVETLGYNKRSIKRLLMKAKSKKQNIIFVGFGGTGVNTWHWLSKMLEWTGVINLFEHVSVYDPDKIEFSNILRFPLDLNKVSSPFAFKTNLFSNYARISRKDPLISQRTFPSTTYYSEESYTRHISDDGKEYEGFTLSPNTFLYGAPDLASRDEFKDKDFIAATHGNDSCSMTIRPEIDRMLQVESYGLIRLTSFFMNQLMMSIGLLEFIASDDEDKWVGNNKKIFDFDFKKLIDENKQGKTEKVLHFQVEHNGLMEDRG